MRSLLTLSIRQIYYTFGPGEEIYAVDWSHKRAASKHKVYDLQGYRVLGPVGVPSANQLFYDRGGRLYMLASRESILYVQPPGDEPQRPDHAGAARSGR